jgi:ribosomal protein S18 acetylase RimI-like enzyme
MGRAFIQSRANRPADVQFRPVVAADNAFLCGLYADTRAAEMALVAWSDEEKAKFLSSQFALQDRHYRNVYIGADFLLIESDGSPIGRIYVYRSSDEIRLMDIALVPAWRNRGIGTALLHELMDEARANGSEITLHVEPDNPAQRLYQRLGFSLIEQRGTYDFLGWKVIGPS